jgi:hypothetical protein
MRTTLVAALMLASIATGRAEVPPTIMPDFYPPPEFDRPFEGSLFIAENLEQEVLLAACNMVDRAKHGLFGCTHLPNTHGLKGDQCVILLAQTSFLSLYGVVLEELKRHEIAHCNGWRHKPPSAAPAPPMERHDPVP